MGCTSSSAQVGDAPVARPVALESDNATRSYSAKKHAMLWKEVPDSFQPQGDLDYNSSESFLQLRRVLDEPVGQLFLARFTRNDKQNHHPVLCWIEIQKFSEIPSRILRLHQARYIFNRFLKEDGECCLNFLSKEEKQYYKERIFSDRGDDAVETTLFQPLQNKCFRLIEKSAFSNFRHAESYEKYMIGRQKLYNRVEPGDFDYMNLLGRGGFGRVCVVRKRSTGKYYAMKVMSKESLLKEYKFDLSRMSTERDVLVKAHHPFIVHLHYAFQDERYLFLVLEYVRGGDLAVNRRAAGGVLPEKRVKFYAAQIVLALHHLHDLNLLYRDLKPRNVLVREDGHICLADMGLAAPIVEGDQGDTENSVSSNVTENSSGPSPARLGRHTSISSNSQGLALDQPSDNKKYGLPTIASTAEIEENPRAPKQPKSMDQPLSPTGPPATPTSENPTKMDSGQAAASAAGTPTPGPATPASGATNSGAANSGDINGGGKEITTTGQAPPSPAGQKISEEFAQYGNQLGSPDPGRKRLSLGASVGAMKRKGSRRYSNVGTAGYRSPEMFNQRGKAEGYGVSVDYWSLGVMICELLTGKKPYQNTKYRNSKKAEKMAVEGPLAIPEGLSEEATDVIKGLLEKDVSRRLGCRVEGSIEDLTSHAFFAGIEWDKLLGIEHQVPFAPTCEPLPPTSSKPQFESLEEVLNKFDEQEMEQEEFTKAIPKPRAVTEDEQKWFVGWDYVSPQVLQVEWNVARELRLKYQDSFLAKDDPHVNMIAKSIASMGSSSPHKVTAIHEKN